MLTHSLACTQPMDTLYGVFNRFAALIPNLQLTELDVDVGDDEVLQADYLRDVMTLAFSHPAFQAIVMWGFWEGKHWKPNAALYRKDWSIKPAGQVWQELVFDTWWTEDAGQTDADGYFATRGFLGDYEIKIKHDGRQQVLKRRLTRDGLEMQVPNP